MADLALADHRNRSMFWSFDGYRYATNSGAWSTSWSMFFRAGADTDIDIRGKDGGPPLA